MQMKQNLKRLLTLGLALTLTMTLAAPRISASDALGSDRRSRSVQLAPGVTYTTNNLWSASKSDLRTERYVTYTPNAQIQPLLYYGSKAKLSTAASRLAQEGYRVVAGINGGYFNPDGTQVGLMFSDGIIRGMDLFNYCMIGFLPDGSAFLDNSTIVKKASWTDIAGMPVILDVTGINASRENGGLYLYDDDFGTSTQNTYDGVDVVLEPVIPGAKPAMNAELSLRVVRVTDSTQEDVEADNVIPAGGFVLSANKNCADWMLDPLRGLVPGMEVTVSVTGGDPRWAQAAYGITGLYCLVKGGQVSPDLPTTAGPCTAIGIRADGSVIFYTIDGRQAGYSVGAHQGQVAERLIELGCVEATGLDGGGSTTFGATLPGLDTFQVLNKPSGGAERSVNNTLFLVTKAPAAGMAERFYVAAKQDVVLAGASTPVAAVPADTYGYPAPSPGAVDWSSDGGTVNLDPQGAPVFTAGNKAGTFTVSASRGRVQGSVTVQVIDQLSRLTITRQDTGKAVSSLKLEPGDTVELDAAGNWSNLAVAMDDSNVVWQTEGEIGVIDAAGFFAAGEKNAEGSILATAGGRTVTIPVKVDNGDPFTDIYDHWSREYVKQIYEMGLTNGIPQPDGTYQYQPEGELSRKEVLTFLSRLLNADTAAYEGVELPFDDAADIPDWALPHVKTLYALQVFRGISAGGKLSAGMDEPLTREMIISLLGRLLAQQKDADLSVFTDEGQISDWAAPYVKTLLAEGVLSGGSGLGPKAVMKRGELAMLLVKVSGLPLIELSPVSD